MLLDDLLARKDEIRRLCEHHGARRIRVFGSVARREERPDSDVDFLVDIPKGYDLFGQRLPLAESPFRTAASPGGTGPRARTQSASPHHRATGSH